MDEYHKYNRVMTQLLIKGAGIVKYWSNLAGADEFLAAADLNQATVDDAVVQHDPSRVRDAGHPLRRGLLAYRRLEAEGPRRRGSIDRTIQCGCGALPRLAIAVADTRCPINVDRDVMGPTVFLTIQSKPNRARRWHAPVSHSQALWQRRRVTASGGSRWAQWRVDA